jgi:hypothetical protein
MPVEELVEGSSLGLAAFVATWSLLAKAPTNNSLVFTGHVAAAEHSAPDILKVGYIASKTHEVRSVGATLVHAGVAAKIDEVIPLVFGKKWRDPENWPPPKGFVPALALVALDLDYRRGTLHMERHHAANRFLYLSEIVEHPNLKALALARAASCFRLLDRHGESRRLIHRALRVARTNPLLVEGEVLVVCLLALAVLQMRAYELDDAATTCREGLSCASAWRLVRLESHLHSTFAQVLLASGQPGEALAHLEQAANPIDDGTHRFAYRMRALARMEAWHGVETLYHQATERLEKIDSPHVRDRHRHFVDHAWLDARVRRGRRSPSEVDWEQTHRRATSFTAESGHRWPQAALRRLEWAAGLRNGLAPDEVILRARDELLAYPEASQARWHLALGLVEACVIEGTTAQRARSLVAEAARHLPSLGAQQWFDAHLRAFEHDPSSTNAIRLLEAERF